MDNQILDRVKVFRDDLGISELELANRIGVGQTTLNYQSHRDDYSYNIIFALAKTFPELSMEWLIRGEGDMYSKAETRNILRLIEETRDVIAKYASDRNRQEIVKINNNRQ